MFTGLVQAVAPVTSLDGHSLEVEWPSAFSEHAPQIGESIAVNGCCLTLTSCNRVARFDLSDETLQRTTFRYLTAGSVVNLERALRAGDPLGGHFMQGHVDGVGTVVSMAEDSGYHRLRIEVPEQGVPLLIDKGSIAIDGISLTVIEPTRNQFEAAIVPHTWEGTNLRFANIGTRVNVEFDMLAKHVQKLLALK